MNIFIFENKEEQNIEELIHESISIMDEKGRSAPGGNSRLLWNKEWDRLRENLFYSLEIIRKEKV
jgi:hypothetical protein